MKKDRFKEQFAQVTAEAFKVTFSDKYGEIGDQEVFSSDFIYDNLEKPKDPTMGRFALPVFRYGGFLGEKPPAIAQKVALATIPILQKLGKESVVSSVATGSFINGRTDFSEEVHQTLGDILTQGQEYGSTDIGQGQKVLVEYSSANIAKPFGIGHLRTTILGNSLRLIFKKLGYDVVGINYLGDWGTQFGKMIVAFEEWGADATAEADSVSRLYELYVKFHQVAETDYSLNDRARQAFRKLEDGDPQATALWERFKTVSWTEFERVYKVMGVEFDWVTGEAYLNDKMEAVIQRLDKAGLTAYSEGALIVDLKDPQLPPCLLRKADGATLYATRDIAGLIFRWGKYHFQQALYVVGSAQADHFKQVFKVVEMLEEAEKTDPNDRITGRAKHIEFGWVKFGDKTMSTRQGNIILLDDVISQAVELARQRIMEKNPGLKNIDETSVMIGVGAVMFSQLSVRRQKDVNFDWDEVLNFEGETGPYLQYTHARLCSLLRNYTGLISSDIDYALLDKEEERRVIELLADFPVAIEDAARAYEPNFITTHLIKLAGAFNKVYQRKDADGRIDKIISDDSRLSAARIALVKAVQTVIKEGLFLLGLKAPDEM